MAYRQQRKKGGQARAAAGSTAHRISTVARSSSGPTARSAASSGTPASEEVSSCIQVRTTGSNLSRRRSVSARQPRFVQTAAACCNGASVRIMSPRQCPSAIGATKRSPEAPAGAAAIASRAQSAAAPASATAPTAEIRLSVFLHSPAQGVPHCLGSHATGAGDRAIGDPEFNRDDGDRLFPFRLLLRREPARILKLGRHRDREPQTRRQQPPGKAGASGAKRRRRRAGGSPPPCR